MHFTPRLCFGDCAAFRALPVAPLRLPHPSAENGRPSRTPSRPAVRCRGSTHARKASLGTRRLPALLDQPVEPAKIFLLHWSMERQARSKPPCNPLPLCVKHGLRFAMPVNRP